MLTNEQIDMIMSFSGAAWAFPQRLHKQLKEFAGAVHKDDQMHVKSIIDDLAKYHLDEETTKLLRNAFERFLK